MKRVNALKALGTGEWLADLGLVDLRAENVSVEQYLQIERRLAYYRLGFSRLASETSNLSGKTRITNGTLLG